MAANFFLRLHGGRIDVCQVEKKSFWENENLRLNIFMNWGEKISTLKVLLGLIKKRIHEKKRDLQSEKKIFLKGKN